MGKTDVSARQTMPMTALPFFCFGCCACVLDRQTWIWNNMGRLRLGWTNGQTRPSSLGRRALHALRWCEPYNQFFISSQVLRSWRGITKQNPLPGT